MSNAEPIAVAILAKAPLPGLAKTRLIPALGREGAALLQARLIARTLATACAAAIGPVRLWGAPDEAHFRELVRRHPVELARQAGGDLGARMLAALRPACPALVIGTDCPALEPKHLQHAAEALRDRADAVIIPAEDGGYVLIGLRRSQPDLFADMPWGTATVTAETRRRAAALGLAVHELPALWDVDVPQDLERLRQAGLGELIPSSDAS
jgi:rSAM/selenodomain-associated transferase 1